jgi:hypothetical protein
MPPRSGSRCHGDLDTADAGANQGAYLQELETDGAAGCLGKVRVPKPDATQGTHEHVGHRGKPQPQLVSTHGGRRRAVGEQVNLTLFNAVFHVAPGAVDPLVEISSLAFGLPERSYDEARIVSATGMLGFGDDPATAAPAVERRSHEVFEVASGAAGAPALAGRIGKFGLDRASQPLVPGQA